MTPEVTRAIELSKELPFSDDQDLRTEAANLLGELAARVADLERLLCIEREAEDGRPF